MTSTDQLHPTGYGKKVSMMGSYFRIMMGVCLTLLTLSRNTARTDEIRHYSIDRVARHWSTAAVVLVMRRGTRRVLWCPLATDSAARSAADGTGAAGGCGVQRDSESTTGEKKQKRNTTVHVDDLSTAGRSVQCSRAPSGRAAVRCTTAVPERRVTSFSGFIPSFTLTFGLDA